MSVSKASQRAERCPCAAASALMIWIKSKHIMHELHRLLSLRRATSPTTWLHFSISNCSAEDPYQLSAEDKDPASSGTPGTGRSESTTYRAATAVRRQSIVDPQANGRCCAVLDLPATPPPAHWPTFWGDIAATITAGRAIAVEAPLTTQHAQERVEILSQGRARTRALGLGRAPTALP